MVDWSRLRFLQPLKVLRGLRSHGLRLALLHGARRVGTGADRALTGPMLLRINPMGFVCNHTCPMCWLQHLDPEELKRQKKIDREQGMRLEDYERLFAAMPAGLEEVNIVGGGEPLVHPQCVEIMRSIKRHGWRGALISNGALLREDAARALVEMEWDFTRISVHAGDAETYRIIQGQDHYATVLSNLQTYAKLRVRPDGSRQGRLTVFHVLQRENLDSIDKLFAFGEAVDADDLVFEKIIPYDDGKVLSSDEVRRAREAVLACARDSRIPCNVDDLRADLTHEERALAENRRWVPARRCSVGYDQTFITALGDVMPCCFSDEVMGNLNGERFDRIWFGPRYAAFRARLNNGKFASYCITNRCTMKGVLHN